MSEILHTHQGNTSVQMPHLRLRRAAPLLALQTHRDSHAATDAECGKALLGIAALHLMQQRDENASTGGANRMAECDGAAIHIDDGRRDIDL